MNDEIWANLKLENEWSLCVQELDTEECIVDPDKQLDLPVRRFNPITRICGSIQEIILEDSTFDALKTKVFVALCFEMAISHSFCSCFMRIRPKHYRYRN